MNNLLSCLILLLLLVSCETQSGYEIKDENGKTGIVVEANGAFTVNNERSGQITEDGVLTDQDGKTIAKIGDDDILVNAEGDGLVKIDENGRIDNGSGIFTAWSEDGEFMQGDYNTGMKMYPVKKESFRNASIILYLYLSMENVVE